MKTHNNSLQPSDTVLKAIRDKVVTAPLSIVEALLLLWIAPRVNHIFPPQQPLLPMILLLLLLCLPLLTFLLLYIHKYKTLKKYILTIDPHFEYQMKFDYWWNYYAKEAEKHK